MPLLNDRRALEGLGLGLAVLAAMWFTVVAGISGGRPWLLAGPFAGTVVAVLGAGRLPMPARRLLLWALTASPLVITLISRTASLKDGPLGYANASAMLFVVAAAAGLVLALSPGRPRLRGAAAVVSACWLLLPWALGALTAGLAGVGVLLVAGFAPRLRARTIVAATAPVVLGLLMMTTITGMQYEPGPRTAPIDRLLDATMGELRVVLWGEATEMIAAEPLTGVGPGRFREASASAAERDDAWWAHSELLQVTAESGIPGGLLLIAVVIWVLVYLRPLGTDPRIAVVVAAIMGSVLNATLDYVWHFPAIPVGLGLLAGAVVGMPSLALGPPPAWRRPGGTALGLTATLGVLLLAPIGLLNPAHTIANGAEVSPNGGLRFPEPGVVRSVAPPVPLYRALSAAEQLTIEFWLATSDRSQDGPARIISSSAGIVHRNFTLGQSEDALAVRIRSTATATDWNALDAAIAVPEVFSTTAIQHVAVTTDLATVEVFVDGERRWSGSGPGGSMQSWNHTYPLLLGNEDSGARPWLGALYGLALHDRVLQQDELVASFRNGPPTTEEPDPAGSRPLAAYAFTDLHDGSVSDRSIDGHGGRLTVPARFASPPVSFLDTFTSTGEEPAARGLGHLLLFAMWSAAIGGLAFRHVPRRWIVGALVVGGAVIASTVTILRYLDERSPSWVDVGAAVVGCLIGTVATTSWSERKGGSEARK